jgi:hypothetical protein
VSSARLAACVATLTLGVVVLAAVGVPAAAAEPESKLLRVGIIGLDTSHVVAFTRVMNGGNPPAELAGIRVVAAYPGGSPDVASSRDRVAGFTAELRDKFMVAIVDSIDDLLGRVDVVLLESRSQARSPTRSRSSASPTKPARRASPARHFASVRTSSNSRAIPRLAPFRAARRIVPAHSKSTIPTCSGTESMGSRCSTP